MVFAEQVALGDGAVGPGKGGAGGMRGRRGKALELRAEMAGPEAKGEAGQDEDRDGNEGGVFHAREF